MPISSTSSSTSLGGGEVLRLSFGCNANLVSSHLVNLEGLGCTNGTTTTTTTSSAPLCDPYITHYCSSSSQLFTPRCIFIDTEEQQLQTRTRIAPDEVDDVSEAWSGKVETVHVLPPSSSTTAIVASTSSYSSHTDNNNPFHTFHQIAQTLADDAYSSKQCSVYSSQIRYSSNQNTYNNNRHVEWDDDEEEDSSDTEEDDTKRQRLLLQEQHKHLQERSALQEDLTNAWDDGVSKISTTRQKQIQWKDYLLPPLPPQNKMISLPYSSSYSSTNQHYFFPSNTATDTAATTNTFSSLWEPSTAAVSSNYYVMDSHFAGYNANTMFSSSSWREDVLSDEIRKSLEQCDLLRGTQLLVSDVGLYTGLATGVLEELTDECKSAARWTILITSSSTTKDEQTTSRRELFRRSLNGGLAFHSLSENSDLFLPLSSSCIPPLHSNTSLSSFTSSALLAAAIETSTIPYRLLPSKKNNNTSSSDAIFAVAGSTGLGSSSNNEDDSFFSTYSTVNFREFLSCLRGPTTRHSILGMDATTTKNKQLDWNELLVQGTSVVFDPRMRERRVSTKDASTREDSGIWISKHLNSLSYNTTSKQTHDDAQHTQYAIHASFRRSCETYPFRPSSYQAQKYRHPLLHGIMEGIATHTRPIGSFSSCLIPQSFAELTLSGGYWKRSILPAIPDFFVSTISNSTRIHPLIEERYNGFKSATSRFSSAGSNNCTSMRGYYTTDVQGGLAPEYEDCDEAREYLKNLDAIYCPSYS